jgi:hypothetical protein
MAPAAAVVVAPAAGVVVAPVAGIHVEAGVHIPLPSVHVGVEIGGPAVIVHERPVIIQERVRVRPRGHR